MLTPTQLPAPQSPPRPRGAVQVPHRVGVNAAVILGARCGTAVDDETSIYFIVPNGALPGWSMTDTTAVSAGAVPIPPARCTEGPGLRWLVCPVGDEEWQTTDPGALAAAIADATALHVDNMQAVIEEALVPGPLPGYVRVAELDVILRAELGRLAPIVRARASSQPADSPLHHEMRWALDNAKHGLACRPGDGLVSAVAALRGLARHTRVLRSYEGDGSNT